MCGMAKETTRRRGPLGSHPFRCPLAIPNFAYRRLFGLPELKSRWSFSWQKFYIAPSLPAWRAREFCSAGNVGGRTDVATTVFIATMVFIANWSRHEIQEHSGRR